ncbi:MAG: phosphate signaling complex protein PhoU [Pyrinomonadaceae bacterium]|nr:phosphate signaling complex protein PhoU [Pyrinomonadaceae bacterium]
MLEQNRLIDKQLDILQDKLLLMGGEAETALQKAMQSLVERDSDLAREVLSRDDAIDQLELEIDRYSVEILALQQPAARDLRFVISIAKITPILERIADHACNIARAAIELNDEPQLKNYVDLPLMEERASKMLREALDAFTSNNAEKAREIILQDKGIDEVYHRVFKDLIEIMSNDPNTTARAARLLFVAKHMERIGDYVKDICELTVYMTEAAFIKHSS